MFRKTARNFNPNMATAAKITVVEVEEIVPAGTFDPDCAHARHPAHMCDLCGFTKVQRSTSERLPAPAPIAAVARRT